MKKKHFSGAFVWGAVLALVSGCAPMAKADLTLYASDTGTQQLFTLNPLNASATLVGSYGHSGMHGLAYDPTHNILFGSDITSNNLYQINQSTGAATLVGPLNVSVTQALAFDVTTSTLYGAYGNFNSPALYTINTSSGAATLVGSLDRPISGLSFDPLTHVLYGSSTSTGSGSVVTINPLTGQVLTQVSSLGFNGLSFDPTSDILYGVSNGGNTIFGGPSEGLYTINTTTGAASLRGALALNNPLDIQFAFTTPAATPEPGSISLLIGLGLSGAVFLKRRRK